MTLKAPFQPNPFCDIKDSLDTILEASTSWFNFLCSCSWAARVWMQNRQTGHQNGTCNMLFNAVQKSEYLDTCFLIIHADDNYKPLLPGTVTTPFFLLRQFPCFLATFFKQLWGWCVGIMVGTQTQNKQMPHLRIFVAVDTSGKDWQKPRDVKRKNELSSADSHENGNWSHKCQQEPSQECLLPVASCCSGQARHSQYLGYSLNAFCHFSCKQDKYLIGKINYMEVQYAFLCSQGESQKKLVSNRFAAWLFGFSFDLNLVLKDRVSEYRCFPKS